MGQMGVLWDLKIAEPSSTSGVAQGIPKYLHVTFPGHLKCPSPCLACVVCQHYFKQCVAVKCFGIGIK